MTEQEKQRKFLEGLQAALTTARKSGKNMITTEQLTAIFRNLSLSADQMKQVREYLADNQVGVDEALPLDEVLTEEEHNYLNDYIREIGELEQPSDDEMDAVKLRAMAGEKDAQQQLVQYMLPKVVDIAKLYAGQGMYMEDLIGIGNEALVIGVSLLGPLDGPDEVESDLATRIMGAMEDAIAANIDEKGKDNDVANRVNKVKDAADELSEALGRKVTPGELAAEGEFSMDQIMDAIRISANHIDSIDYKQP